MTAPAGSIKAYWAHYVLNDSTAGSRGNTQSSVGAFESLWNHCKQHLVALFAPAPPLRGGKRDHGTRANTCTMTVRQLRAQGDVDRVFLSLRKHCVSCRTYRVPIHVNSRAPLARSLLTDTEFPSEDIDSPSWDTDCPSGCIHSLSWDTDCPSGGIDSPSWHADCPSGCIDSHSWGTDYPSVGMDCPSGTIGPSPGAIIWLSAIVADASSQGVLLQLLCGRSCNPPAAARS